MFLKIQAAFRAIENELDPDKAALRNSAFREYDTNRKDSSGNAFKSRRGAKTAQETEDEAKKRARQKEWDQTRQEFMNQSGTTSYDY